MKIIGDADDLEVSDEDEKNIKLNRSAVDKNSVESQNIYKKYWCFRSKNSNGNKDLYIRG